MTKELKNVYRYSFSFKQQVLKEIESGKSISDIAKRYDIKGGGTIQSWIKKYGKNNLLNRVVRIETMEEKDQLKALKEENKRLKLSLADAILEKDVLTNLISIVNEHYKTDVKKNFGKK